MVGTCITVAQSSDFKPVWEGMLPIDFGSDLARLSADYEAVCEKNALAKTLEGGAADDKAVAETVLEGTSFTLARALANHFKKTGALDLRNKVDLTKTDINKLRDRELADQATAIRDLALAALAQPGADGRGITEERIALVTESIALFEGLLAIPRTEIVNRVVLIKEIKTDVALILDQLRDLDDLVLQFEPTPESRRFAQAWKRARTVVDAGRGPAAEVEENAEASENAGESAESETPTPPEP